MTVMDFVLKSGRWLITSSYYNFSQDAITIIMTMMIIITMVIIRIIVKTTSASTTTSATTTTATTTMLMTTMTMMMMITKTTESNIFIHPQGVHLFASLFLGRSTFLCWLVGWLVG